jgi:hypothetical protein
VRSPTRERRDRADNRRDVFINCPFSSDYQVNFQAIVFTVVRSGFKPRCARESDDGGEIRLDKICKIILECPYSVHDISKTEPDAKSKLPRFNMPFELGLYLGAKRFGDGAHRSKRTLIFDRELYRYQSYISDIAGQDIHSHRQQLGRMIQELANWLRDFGKDPKVPGGKAIAAEFRRFRTDLARIAAEKQLELSDLTFRDLAGIAATWVVQESGVGTADVAPHASAASRSMRKARAAGSVWRPIAKL